MRCSPAGSAVYTAPSVLAVLAAALLASASHGAVISTIMADGTLYHTLDDSRVNNSALRVALTGVVYGAEKTYMGRGLSCQHADAVLLKLATASHGLTQHTAEAADIGEAIVGNVDFASCGVEYTPQTGAVSYGTGVEFLVDQVSFSPSTKVIGLRFSTFPSRPCRPARGAALEERTLLVRFDCGLPRQRSDSAQDAYRQPNFNAHVRLAPTDNTCAAVFIVSGPPAYCELQRGGFNNIGEDNWHVSGAARAAPTLLPPTDSGLMGGLIACGCVAVVILLFAVVWRTRKENGAGTAPPAVNSLQSPHGSSAW